MVTFEYAIAAGLSPVATTFSDLSHHMEEETAKVKSIGTLGEPSLEKIVKLNPDLIVGLGFNQSAYSQTTLIAPTILFDYDHSGQWKLRFQEFANALNRAQVAEQVMADYKKRLKELRLKTRVAANTPSTTSAQDYGRQLEVSVIRVYPDSVSLYLRDSFSGTVLQDAGLARPPSQNIGAEEAKALYGNPIQTRISRELLHMADGDVIFVWTGESTAEGAASAQRNLDQLQHDPLWRQLRAVQAGRVYNVPSYWIGSGPIAANAILDDLSHHLVEPV
jgi:iron complex transport system substrate-binding protein